MMIIAAGLGPPLHAHESVYPVPTVCCVRLTCRGPPACPRSAAAAHDARRLQSVRCALVALVF